MKRYKLKKDLPAFRAGDLFELRDDGCLYFVRGWRNPDEVKYYDKEVIAYHKNTLKFFPNIITDWFEEVNESTRWKPEVHQCYYYIASSGGILDDVWNNYDSDLKLFSVGNCFKTKEEAERVVEYLKALAMVREDSTTKFTKGCKNWCVYYDSVYNYLATESNFSDINNGIFGLPYFATEDDAQKSIELHRNEWLTIFGVEDKK